VSVQVFQGVRNQQERMPLLIAIYVLSEIYIAVIGAARDRVCNC
jgi:hypothetical protein